MKNPIPRTIRLSPEADRALRRLAKAEKRSQSKMVEVAILEYSRAKSDPPAPPPAAPEA